MFKIVILSVIVALAHAGNKIKYNALTIGDTLAHPEMEFELGDPKPYDWKNEPTPKPYVNEFKIAQPLDDAARHAEPEIPQPPQPFSFGFQAMANDGTQSRQESQDASGKVTGSYTIVDANGAQRIVEYYADDTGFHANIKSNEPGIEQGEGGAGATYEKL
ncbi:hypothetical protein DERP_012345 [Dermatophagoides pteronyssinus]|nr:hypothetical protein DERP_012345 [Dermatophagoides pteronyssinus]